MPFTFFAHQVVVLPLKWWKPDRFDGTALCVGSMAPDFAYAFTGTKLAFGSHNIPAQFTWTLPLTLAATYCLRRHVAVPVGSQLPEPLGGEVRALARSRPSLPVSACSAVLGGLSHIFIDAFTHPHGWAFERFASLRHELLPDVTVAQLLQYLGHTLGSAIGMLLFASIVMQRRISRWNRTRTLPDSSENAAWFWPFISCGALLSVPAAWSATISGGGLPVAIIRAAWVLTAVLMVAALRVRRRSLVAEQLRS